MHFNINSNSDFNDFIKEKFPEAETNSDGDYKWFTSFEDEVQKINFGVGVRVCPTSILSLKGQMSQDFLHRISTNELKSLKTSQFRNTFFLNEKGRFIDSTEVIRFENEILLSGSASNASKLFNWLDRYIISEDITITDKSEEYIKLEFWGKQKESFVTLFDLGDLQVKGPDEFRVISLANCEAIAYCNNLYDGNKKFEILIHSADLRSVLTFIFSNKSVFNFGLIGEEAFTSFRIDNEIPIAVNEFNDDFNPFDFGILSPISFTKGCYIGQEVIARIDTYGKANKKFLAFLIEEKSRNGFNQIVNSEGLDVGKVTSFGWSAKNNKSAGLASIKFDDKIETDYFLKCNTERIPIKLVHSN